MNIRISKNKFYEALQIVSRAIAPNSPVPALSGIKIEAYTNELVITGSDADISIKMVLSNETEPELNLSVIEEGSVVIDYRYLNEIVRKIDSEEVQIEIIDGTLTRFSGGKAEFKINGFRASDYPTIDFSVPSNHFTIRCQKLSEIIEETAFAVNSKDTRVILTGVNMKCDGNVLICTATDSYRLAKKTINTECEPFGITVVAKTLNMARSIFGSSDSDVEISQNDKKIVFSEGGIIMQSRLLDGTFPETERLIPTEFSRELVINRRSLISALDRSSFIKTDNMSIIRCQINGNEVLLTNKSQEIGEAHEELVAESYTGEPLDISFSGTYVEDAAKALSSENICIKFTGEMKPFILVNDGEDTSLLQLVLPVRTYN